MLTVAEHVPHRLRPPLRDAWNRLRHGPEAPRYAERLWVRPGEVEERVSTSRRLWTGRVVAGDWDLERAPLDTMPKVQACIERWELGRDWEATGVYATMQRLIEERGRPKDGCADLGDVVRRYERLDAIFERVRSEGRLRTRAELGDGFRELGGVLINVDRHGRPVAGGGGWHRLAMARILALPVMPAQVGLVHRDALPGWRERFTRSAAPS